MDDFSDFLKAAVMESVVTPDPMASFDGLLSARLTVDFNRMASEISASASVRDSYYHDSARRNIQRTTGVTDEVYDIAMMENKAGDPSLLLKLRTDYLDTL